MEYKILKTNVTDGVAVITISRPEALNALNSEFFTEFNDYLNTVEKDDKIKVLVITGEGKAFVAGADISELVNMNYEKARCFSKLGQNTFSRLEGLKIPVIAAVNGYALGGGCELAMACDFRIVSKNAKFGQPEVQLGLIPGYAGTQRFTRLAGLGNALFAMLSGEMIGAEDAVRMGLAQKMTEPDKLLEEVLIIAAKMAANGSQAVRKAKEIIRKGYCTNLKEGSELESEAFAKLFDYPSTKEGMKAFLEKRKPNW
jgi:enoyl-CoA hydratase